MWGKTEYINTETGEIIGSREIKKYIYKVDEKEIIKQYGYKIERKYVTIKAEQQELFK